MDWLCLDCNKAVSLNLRGNCGICNSKAVDHIEPRPCLRRSPPEPSAADMQRTEDEYAKAVR